MNTRGYYNLLRDSSDTFACWAKTTDLCSILYMQRVTWKKKKKEKKEAISDTLGRHSCFAGCGAYIAQYTS